MSEFLGTHIKDIIIFNEVHDTKTRREIIKYLTTKDLPPKELALLEIREQPFF